ncbi:MAG: hypothetical protein WBA13_21945 [Microcoleaceae cyanobacterium]
MTDNQTILQKAAQTVTRKLADKPTPQSVVTALLNCEKQAKKQSADAEFQQLVGCWRLCFITGTKKARDRAGIALGAGRYLARWVKITITYSALDTENKGLQNPDLECGQVQNSVTVGGLNLILSGPVKFIKHKILAFDFTRITVKLSGFKIYEGNVRGGREKEAEFNSQPLKKQAFFNYFLIKDDIIAARGKGGGLALWGKEV